MNYMTNLPNKLREFRYRQLSKQSEVAERIGIGTSDRISQWETGHSMPSVENLFKLAKLFETTPEELYPDLWVNTRS